MPMSASVKRIERFDYAPRFQKFREKGRFPSNLYMGFEMEVDPRGDYDDFFSSVRELINEHKFLYAKEDGSVEGCEVNTHPFNWNWFIKRKPLECVNSLREVGKATRACGFHVHLSRDFFTKEHLAKMINLFYNNPGFITKISQRGSRANMRDFCDPVMIWDDDYDLEEVSYRSGKLTKEKCLNLVGMDWECDLDRYWALNLAPDNTVEIRIFQGTINKKLIRAYLEFCLACVLYTKETLFGDISVKGFRKFVRVHKRKFPMLNKVRLLTKCQEKWRKCA